MRGSEVVAGCGRIGEGARHSFQTCLVGCGSGPLISFENASKPWDYILFRFDFFSCDL